MSRFILFIFFFAFSLDVQAESKKPSDVYAKVKHLNEGITMLIRQSYGRNQNIKIEPSLLKNKIHPRHVFQKVLDIEDKLIALMRLNGLNVTQTETLLVQPYKPEQVFSLLSNLDQRIHLLLEHHNVEIPLGTVRAGNQKPEDVYHLLERLEKFLLKMGAPSTQPANVLKRATAISFISSRLCTIERCQDIKRRSLDENELLIPLHVYQETYRFIHTLHNFVERFRIKIEGGVLALPAEESLILPAHVNNMMGVALADLIEIMKHRDTLKSFNLSETNPRALPKDVWIEVNFARRLLETMIEN